MTAAETLDQTLDQIVVTEPGVYDGMPAEVYHADPVPGGSLSSTGARKLLPPSCPALYRYWATAGEPPSRTFDFGHAAHRMVLGVGERLVVVDAENWRTKAAQAARDEAYAAGAVPLLTAEHEQVQAMAGALRAHPVAAALFRPDGGRPEQSLFWTDREFGVWRRARLDWLRNPGAGRLIIPDYKTTTSAEPGALAKTMYSYGYYQQAAWYLDAVRVLGLADDAAFVFVFQEKDPPYLVTICEPDHLALLWGQRLNRKALDVYRRCRTTGVWPGYADDVVPLALPMWAENQHQAAFERGDYDIDHDVEETR
jgi:hypothetical protein